jgi:hypothetical protein
MVNPTYKVDLHNHLGPYGRNPGFNNTINIASKHLGRNGVFGITNSSGPSSIDGADRRFQDFYDQREGYERDWVNDEHSIFFVPEKGIYVVGVEEVITREGHLVVAGMPFTKKIQQNNKTLSLEEALKRASDLNCIKIAVHPCGRDGIARNKTPTEANMVMLDGWEVYNASAALSVPGILPFKANEKSNEFYNRVIRGKFSVGQCAFTDGHSANVIGRAYTTLSMDNPTIENMRVAIRFNIDSETLHCSPAKIDAFIHAYRMTVRNIGLRKD